MASTYISNFVSAGPESVTAKLLAEVICSANEKSGYVPQTIFVRTKSLTHVLAPLAAALHLSITHRANLKSIREAKDALTNALLWKGM